MNKNYRTINYVKKWRNIENQNYTLFREKYTYEFSRFCLDLRIAHECDEGINVYKEVAYLYMNYLGQTLTFGSIGAFYNDRKKVRKLSVPGT